MPYKSTAQALTDLIGDQVTFLFVDLASSQAHVKSGRVRLLTVSSELKSPQAPELPTLASAANLPGFDLSAWIGVLAPAGLPADITAHLSEQINRTLQRKDIAPGSWRWVPTWRLLPRQNSTATCASNDVVGPQGQGRGHHARVAVRASRPVPSAPRTLRLRYWVRS